MVPLSQNVQDMLWVSLLLPRTYSSVIITSYTKVNVLEVENVRKGQCSIIQNASGTQGIKQDAKPERAGRDDDERVIGWED